MRVVVITQNDPFYLAKNLDYFFQRLPDYVEIVGCIVSDVSPFGRKETLVKKALKTYRIFGLQFFIRYFIRYLRVKLDPNSKVASVLKKYNIYQLELPGSINSKDSIELIKALRPDLLISIAGNEIFRKSLIELAPRGCLNLHTALLPNYRGLMPSFWVLKNKEKETGVSVFYVDEGIDSGPILVQKRIPVNNMTQQELIILSKKIGMDAIIEAIEKIYRSDDDTIENNDNDMSYYSFPTRKDVKEFLSNGGRFY